MSSYTFLLLCIQILFIQNAFSQVLTTNVNSAVKGGVTNAYGGVSNVAATSQLPVGGPYGGVGTGEISVAGEVSAAGQTVVTGQVPVIGSVQFSGQLPASGVVSIAGNCGCGNVL